MTARPRRRGPAAAGKVRKMDPKAPFEPQTNYTISSGEWCPVWSPLNKNLARHDEPGQMDGRWETVLPVASAVYCISKVFLIICEEFGVELDDSPTGIKFHIKQVEAEMESDTLVSLILAIEDLYYVLYARLAIEVGNVQLCTSFDLDIRGMSGKDVILLPEPERLLDILAVCKKFLDNPRICGVLNEEIIKQHQEKFMKEDIQKYRDANDKNNATDGNQQVVRNDDDLGYRRHIREMINDPDSEFQKWKGLNPVFKMAPNEILAFLSEKYLFATPREASTGNYPPSSGLPFVDPTATDPLIWEAKTIRAHRQATLAILESRCVGEVRREEDEESTTGPHLMAYVKEKKCICFNTCSCARDCTRDVERPCPCAERMMRALLLEESDQSLGQQCTILAEVIFEGLVAMKKDATMDDMSRELLLGIELFYKEVWKKRSSQAEKHNRNKGS